MNSSYKLAKKNLIEKLSKDITKEFIEISKYVKIYLPTP